MSLSMYQASVPVFTHGLANLSDVLKKGEAHARKSGGDPAPLLQQRLIFDMFPLVKQVQRACDTAARGIARLVAAEPRAFPDTETTFADLYQRLEATIGYLESFTPQQIDGCEGRPVELKVGSSTIPFTGKSFLLAYAIPNFFFHCTTAYDIVRVAGAPVGKRDFLGASE